MDDEIERVVASLRVCTCLYSRGVRAELLKDTKSALWRDIQNNAKGRVPIVPQRGSSLINGGKEHRSRARSFGAEEIDKFDAA